MLSLLTFFLLDTAPPVTLDSDPEDVNSKVFVLSDRQNLDQLTVETQTRLPVSVPERSAEVEVSTGSDNVPSSLRPPITWPLPDVSPSQPSRSLPARTRQIQQVHEIRPLPGQLDEVPVFNSNNPEVVQREGILLSTFSPKGKRYPQAHLDFTFRGRFDIFTHHLARARTPAETRTLFQGVILHNPAKESVRVRVHQGGSYLTKPDALFVDLPSYVEDPVGMVYAGPGSRLSNEVLRGRRQGNWPSVIEVPPRSSHLLMNLPIPVWDRTPSSNARSTLIRLESDGPVKVANMAMFAPLTKNGQERVPTLREWQLLLLNASLVYPRDRAPTPPGAEPLRYIYGRVAGIAQGSRWDTTLTDAPDSPSLTIPDNGKAISYVLSSLPRGTFGTGQVQSAPILKRYDDASYMAHGNYGVEYNLQLPLENAGGQSQQVAIALQTPLKANEEGGVLNFLEPPDSRVFFRGIVRIRYQDTERKEHTRYVHLVQRRGEQGEPLLLLQMPPGDRRDVEVSFIYPPDATPPQVLTVQTLDQHSAQLAQPVLSDRRE